MGFANLAAFDRFDPREPTASRFVEEDLNRLWDPAVLDGPRLSNELSRARQIRPVIERADVLLDLHSMLWASEPLLLSGETEKGRALAASIGVPDLVVADRGHVSGRRLIDYGGFADPAAPACAVLVEAGQHWTRQTVEVTLACVAGLLRRLDMADVHPDFPPAPSLPTKAERFARVTHAVTASTLGVLVRAPVPGRRDGARGRDADCPRRRRRGAHALRRMLAGNAEPAPEPRPHRRPARPLRALIRNRSELDLNAGLG